MKHAHPGHGMVDLLHGDTQGEAESWLRSLIVRRFAVRGHHEHGGLGHPRRSLPRTWVHDENNAQDGRGV